MEQVPVGRPEQKQHPLWNLYVPAAEVEAAQAALRAEWPHLLGETGAREAAERGLRGVDLDAGGEIECPACGHRFTPAGSAAECPDCGLALGAPADAAPDEQHERRARPMTRDLSDLHIHVGGAAAPHTLWSIAHEQGLKLPVADYWEFRELVSARPGKVEVARRVPGRAPPVDGEIQSSPQAMERSVYEIIGKEYRSSRVNLIELRFNPMKRNQGGERDLDHIIHAALRGMDRGVLEYGVQAGLIFCLAREFEHSPQRDHRGEGDPVPEAGRGRDRPGRHRAPRARARPGVVGKYRELFAHARKAGLKTTVHTGETAGTGAEGVRAVVEQLEPDRIGHGIRAAQDERVMALLRERGVMLEICPTSNLATRAVSGTAEMREVLQKLWRAGVRFTINTDGPYLLDTDMRREVGMLRGDGVLADEQIDQAFRWAREATFIETRARPEGWQAYPETSTAATVPGGGSSPARTGASSAARFRAMPSRSSPGAPAPESRGSSMASRARAAAGSSARPSGAGAKARPSRSLASAVR